MRVLLIDVNCKYSSTGKIVYALFDHMNKLGDIVSVCYGRGEKIEEDGIYKFGLDTETKLHALLTRISGLTGVFSYFSTKRLIRYIEKFHPDVVHIHELHAYFVNIKPLINYLKKKNIPIVWTFHCEFMYTGKCGVAYDCQKYKTGCGRCPHLTTYPKTLFFDFTHYMWMQKKKLLCDYQNIVIVTPSQWLADRTKSSFLKKNDIKIIHNGIDTSIFKSCATRDDLMKEYGFKADRIILSVASHITTDPNKGAKYIFELAKKLVDKSIHFILVGADESTIQTKDNVTIVPTIKDQKKLAHLYSASDVFLLCSERENFPTTSMEAQCCGTQICGFDVGGVKETVTSDMYLCDYGDIETLENNLLAAMDHSYDSTYARQVYSKQRMLDEYYQLYKIMISEGKRNG